MTEEKQEGQKTVVSFIVGLLIGGLLVWAFSGPAATAPADKDDVKDAEKTESSDDKDKEEKVEEKKDKEEKAPAPELKVGEGKVSVDTQTAGKFVTLTSATYPVSEGWIGVRDYSDEKLGGLLGVARFSEKQGLVPNGVVLQRATEAGKDYAVVVFTENGDREFNLANDKQLDSVFATFKAK